MSNVVHSAFRMLKECHLVAGPSLGFDLITRLGANEIFASRSQSAPFVELSSVGSSLCRLDLLRRDLHTAPQIYVCA